MIITLVNTPLAEVKSDVLLVGQFEGEEIGQDILSLDAALSEQITHLRASNPVGELSGKCCEITSFYTAGTIAAGRLVVVGLGKRDTFDANRLRRIIGTSLRTIRDRKIRTVATALQTSSASDILGAASALVEGALLAMWEPDSHKSTEEAKKGSLSELIVVDAGKKPVTGLLGAIHKGQTLGESANQTRNLVNAPANELPPAQLAEAAKTIGSETGLAVEIIDEDQMFKLGMGGILAVSVGSENRAQLIVMRHMPNPGNPTLALVGKGITFDTGGISIKPTEGMGQMKGDMAGAATVLGAMRAIALLNIPVNVVGLAVCAENMPDGKAFRPGDVVRFMNGKTSEIMTTDAEGRLVLADALCYAVRNLKAERIVDIATLTGACGVALAHVYSGAFSNDEALITAVRSSAASVGEKVWQLPVDDDYKEMIVSDIADMKNSGGRWGGASTAAAFLREFVDNTPWVHLDVAGTASPDKSSPALARGASGVMVRTFVQLAEQLAG